MVEILKIKNAIPKRWKYVLNSNNSKKSQVRTSKTLSFGGKKLSNMESKDIYNILKESIKEKPIGFTKWEKELNIENISYSVTNMLKFMHDYLKDNKLREFRWKLLHYIIPCNKLLQQWRVISSPVCNICNVVETYDHYFLTCRYLENFWNEINILFEKIKLDNHIISLKSIVLGYKTNEIGYYELNYLLTIIIFTIYKSYCVSEHKKTHVNVYTIFKNEFIKRHEIGVIRKENISKFIKSIVQNL